ncbi:hypothetical protein TELCIR_03642 [Teladorsagia circumcincta]|uniref:Uncharacterized protein n=1 Tax=Teladorsagia circumcincta TaxID=45464 RepID=A0A2G9UVW8_TELCI|nr:hypothetical protein TELCIR_03642 [Teladorsagia circumcincta]
MNKEAELLIIEEQSGMLFIMSSVNNLQNPQKGKALVSTIIMIEEEVEADLNGLIDRHGCKIRVLLGSSLKKDCALSAGAILTPWGSHCYPSALLAFVGVCSAQLFAWPSSSYSPYYARYYAAASAPVQVAPAPVAAAYPAMAAPPMAMAAPPMAAAYASPLSPPVAAGPAMAAATANGAPLLTPAYAAPAYAAPAYAAYAPAPMAAAPVAMAPAVVPAYAPFRAAAYLIGSNKAAATKV